MSVLADHLLRDAGGAAASPRSPWRDATPLLKLFARNRLRQQGRAALRDTCCALMQPGTPWPAALDPAIAWLTGQLPRLYGDDARVRAQDLQQLARLAAGHGSRERFLTELTLDPPEATSDEAGPPHRDDDYLILSTIHSAKGQEWDAVHVLNVVDGCMPADLATGRISSDEWVAALRRSGHSRRAA